MVYIIAPSKINVQRKVNKIKILLTLGEGKITFERLQVLINA